MSRGLSSGQIAATTAPHRQIVPLVELFFQSGTLQLALSPFDYTGLSGTYIHTGPLAYIKPASESSSSQEGLELGMTGLDTAIFTLAATEPYRGRIVRLLKGYLNPTDNSPIGEPTVVFVGRMVNMNISEDNGSAAVAILVEHYEIELTRPAPIRWSDADQQRLFPSDLGCQYAAATSEKTVVWPSKLAQGG
jgi:hypothetical protein